jgi:hypothetical protein
VANRITNVSSAFADRPMKKDEAAAPAAVFAKRRRVVLEAFMAGEIVAGRFEPNRLR